jgi:predicted enzyme related to lactoylglutathione lyase
MSTIVLWVSDINRQADFYSALLGAPIASKSDDFCAVGDEKNSVLLHLLPMLYRIEGSSPVPAQEEVAIKPIFAVASINEAIARATADEIRTLGEVKSYNSIAYLDCIDPEGNVIQLSEAQSN